MEPGIQRSRGISHMAAGTGHTLPDLQCTLQYILHRGIASTSRRIRSSLYFKLNHCLGWLRIGIRKGNGGIRFRIGPPIRWGWIKVNPSIIGKLNGNRLNKVSIRTVRSKLNCQCTFIYQIGRSGCRVGRNHVGNLFPSHRGAASPSGNQTAHLHVFLTVCSYCLNPGILRSCSCGIDDGF